jgi:hypothetical protein
MKTLVLALSILSLSIHAEELRVSHMKNTPGMDRSFVLKTKLPAKVVLDCQSFIQGLTIGEQLFMMDASHCETLAKSMMESFKTSRSHCIDVEDEVRSDYTCP